jgi:hypothetical protein
MRRPKFGVRLGESSGDFGLKVAETSVEFGLEGVVCGLEGVDMSVEFGLEGVETSVEFPHQLEDEGLILGGRGSFLGEKPSSIIDGAIRTSRWAVAHHFYPRSTNSDVLLRGKMTTRTSTA